MPSPIEILHLKCNDDAENTIVVDYASGGNNGTLTGAGNTSASSVAGKISKALSFDGVNDYILRANFGDLGSNANKTICFWIYKYAHAAQYDRYFAKHKSSTALAYGFVSGGANDGFYFNDGTEMRFGFTRLSTLTAHHVMATYDEASGAIETVWVDGVSVSNVSPGTGWGFEANDNLNIGGRAGTGQFPNIWIEDFRIFDGKLDATQNGLIYNDGDGTYLSLAELENPPSSGNNNLMLLGVG